jgi:hypothetical protein
MIFGRALAARHLATLLLAAEGRDRHRRAPPTHNPSRHNELCRACYASDELAMADVPVVYYSSCGHIGAAPRAGAGAARMAVQR